MVEILVVIAIIAILCALLIGGMKSLRNKAASTQAVNNLRSMGQALASNVAENDGRLIAGAKGPILPAGELSSSQGPAVAYWFNALDYYMGGKDYTIEGMKAAERPVWQRDALKRYPEWKTLASYGISVGFGWNHQYFGLDSQSQNRIYGWESRIAQVEQPSRTIIIGTGEDNFNETNPGRNVMIYANSIRCRRHQGGGYYLFLDGHVKHLTPEEVMANNSALMKKQK